MAVFDEVVTEGKARQYDDAYDIEAILMDRVEVIPVNAVADASASLGLGERAILALLPRTPDAIVISDDNRFLTVLSLGGIRYMSPADTLLFLFRSGELSKAEALAALERLRPSIRRQAYADLLTTLGLGDTNE